MKKFFHPSSICVVGASSTPGKVGYILIKNLLYGEVYRGYEYRFEGKIYPVNRKGETIFGIKAFKSIKDLPEIPDVTAIAIPAEGVIEVVKDGLSKGIERFVIISAGFSESGEEGKRREKALYELIKGRARVIGPNCLGIMSSPCKMNLSFTKFSPPPGKIAFISQSGAIGSSVVDYAREELFGISYFASLGNKMDVEDTELLKFFAEEEAVNCISIYMESTKDGRKFYETLKEVTEKKPVVILKAGVSEIGARAAKSHTGAIAGNDLGYDAAIKQAGALRARTMLEFFDFSRALAYQPPLFGDVAILTNAGGPGIIAADMAYRLGLPLASLSPDTLSKISSVCPPTWSRGNPVDIIGDADPERFKNVFEILMSAPEVGGIIFIVSRQGLTRLEEISENLIISMEKFKNSKPVIACFVGIIGQEDVFLNNHGIPAMEVPERAVRAMYALYRRGKFLKKIEKG
jgi:acetyltransferase